jgi:prepilin-type N-terminal cleavage/methylation domain-containing protein
MMMISRTGPITPARRNAVGQGGAAGRARRGFTLIETLLTLCLILLLLGVAALATGGWIFGNTLEEGASRVESALRLARADAANQCRRVRLAFPADGSPPQVLWEAQPLEQPGVFTAFVACTWTEVLALDGLRVDRCEPVGPSTQRKADWGAATSTESDDVPAAVTFEPNGSSDSVVLSLSVDGRGDTRRATLELDGRTGLITTSYTSAADAAAEP